jgi:exodeoxyribonuclease VII large subunit
MTACLDKRRRSVDALGQLLRSLSHKSVLDRGFALVRDPEGRMLRAVADAEAAGRAELEFGDGRIWTTVDGANPAELKAARRPGEGSAKAKTVKEKQGQLF